MDSYVRGIDEYGAVVCYSPPPTSKMQNKSTGDEAAINIKELKNLVEKLSEKIKDLEDRLYQMEVK